VIFLMFLIKEDSCIRMAMRICPSDSIYCVGIKRARAGSIPPASAGTVGPSQHCTWYELPSSCWRTSARSSTVTILQAATHKAGESRSGN
jgi:hypothetical protein